MDSPDRPRVIALGFFDGVHMGHAALLKRTAEAARKRGALSCVLTFDVHPETVIAGNAVPLLNTLSERADIMRGLFGMDEIIFSHFDSELAHMKWQDFIEQLLLKRYHAVHVVAGHDFHFGYKGLGNPERLKTKCAEMRLGCDIIERVEIDDITVSSTYIRRLVAQGEMEQAAIFLGRPHFITGQVVHGRGLGRDLNIPTANFELSPDVQEPARGVYITRTTIDGTILTSITNVGIRPTVTPDLRLVVETHILDYTGDLYNKLLKVEFLSYLRPEKRFYSHEDLKKQIDTDIRQVRDYISIQKQYTQ